MAQEYKLLYSASACLPRSLTVKRKEQIPDKLFFSFVFPPFFLSYTEWRFLSNKIEKVKIEFLSIPLFRKCCCAALKTKGKFLLKKYKEAAANIAAASYLFAIGSVAPVYNISAVDGTIQKNELNLV